MSQGKLTSSLLFAAVPALFAAACVETPTQGGLDLGTESEEILGCSAWGCNSNSPQIDIFDFHELEETGVPNLEGVRLLGLIKGSTFYNVDVVGAQIYARTGSTTITGAALINSYMLVQTPDGVYYRIIIKNVSHSVEFWVGDPTIIETYDLVYTKHFTPGDPRPVCKNTPSRLDPEGQFWLKPYEAIVFTGDRYNKQEMDVTAASYVDSGNWFNLGCAGSALAKLHLNRHTTAGSDSTHITSLARRQAMLKMYVSDVCGNGFTSTKQGTPLVWQNLGNWQTLPPGVAAHEGAWGANGMLCLDTHRLENDPAWGGAGGIEAQIIAACGSLPDDCSVVYPGWPNVWPRGAYLRTAIP